MQALIRRDDANLRIDFTEAALALKANALEAAALIGKVDSPETQIPAVAAQTQLWTFIGLCEKARRAAKEAPLEFGRRIDQTHKEFVQEVKDEYLRLSEAITSFQQLEAARVRAEQQAANDRLLEIERERARELQQAKSHEQMEAIQEKFAKRAEAEAPAAPITPARAPGQRVTEDWEITVVDIWLLAKAHPGCVKIEARLSEIKSLLDAGVKVAGVLAKRAIKAGVAPKTPKAIDV